MNRLTRDGTADQILRREPGQGKSHFPCSADHEQDWQPYPVDPYSCYICDHTYCRVCVCVVFPFILDVRIVDVPIGVIQEEGHTGLLHLPSAVLVLNFLARSIQPFLFLVDREVEFCLLTT